jgi:hypothetical protein
MLFVARNPDHKNLHRSSRQLLVDQCWIEIHDMCPVGIVGFCKLRQIQRWLAMTLVARNSFRR